MVRRRTLLRVAAGGGLLAAVAGRATASAVQEIPAGGVVYALDRADGTVQWRREFETIDEPVLAGGTLVVGGNSAVRAVETDDGTTRWSTDVGLGGRTHPFEWHRGLAASGETVYATLADDTLHAIEPATGETRWRYPLRSSWKATPRPEGDSVYVPRSRPRDDEAAAPGELHALDAETGERRWRVTAEHPFRRAPGVADGLVHAATTGHEDGSNGGRVLAVDAASGSLEWDHGVENGFSSDVIAVSTQTGTLAIGLADHSTVHAITDGRGLWQFDVEGDGPVAAAPVVANGQVYAPNRGVSVLDQATGTEEDRLGESLGVVTATPAVVGSDVYVSTESGVSALSDAGRVQWRTDVRSDFEADWTPNDWHVEHEWWLVHTPVVDADTVYVTAHRWQAGYTPVPTPTDDTGPAETAGRTESVSQTDVTESNGADGPGFGVTGALGGVGVVAYGLHRLRNGDA